MSNFEEVNVDKLIEEISESNSELDPRILKVHNIAMKLLKLDDFNVVEKARVAPSLSQSFLTAYFAENKKLAKYEKRLIELKDEYCKKFGKPGIPKFKTDEEAKSSTEYKKLEENIEVQRDLVKYIFETTKIFSWFNFSIKNAVDLMRLDNRE